MAKLISPHGGTDAGPEPRHDFSSNANALGPCPSVLRAIRAADLTHYPDPLYTELRETLGNYHRVDPRQIVIGAGASELILRIIRWAGGSVVVPSPTFSEYARCAQLEGRTVIPTRSPEEFLHAQRSGRNLGFLGWPNNPTGEQVPLDFLAEAARKKNLVVDLAYAPLCSARELAAVEQAAVRAIRLYAPNKSFGLTGVRAAYAVTPERYPALTQLAPSWVIGQAEAAFLHATIQPAALRWLKRSLPTLAQWRQALAVGLNERGIEVHESPATFLLARVGPAKRLTAALRERGIRVRDCTSFGLRAWIRLSAQSPASQNALFAALDGFRSDGA